MAKNFVLKGKAVFPKKKDFLSKFLNREIFGFWGGTFFF